MITPNFRERKGRGSMEEFEGRRREMLTRGVMAQHSQQHVWSIDDYDCPSVRASSIWATLELEQETVKSFA